MNEMRVGLDDSEMSIRIDETSKRVQTQYIIFYKPFPGRLRFPGINITPNVVFTLEPFFTR